MNKLSVIDFETTGMEPPAAEVIEVGRCDLWRDGDNVIVGVPRSWLCGGSSNPPEARAVNHIPLADIIGLEPFSAADLNADMATDGVVAVAAHNAEFEARFFTPTVPLLCTYKAALRVWPDAPGHSNNVLRYWLEDMGVLSLVHEETQPAHRAGPDAYVTAHILKALLEHATASQMIAWTKEPRLLPTIPIGKQRGAKWSEVDGGFLSWMLNQATMEEDLKWNARRELDRRGMKQ